MQKTIVPIIVWLGFDPFRPVHSHNTHVEFQDYGGHVAMVPGECDRKDPIRGCSLAVFFMLVQFFVTLCCLLSVSRSINVWLKEQARCALIQDTTCFSHGSGAQRRLDSMEMMTPEQLEPAVGAPLPVYRWKCGAKTGRSGGRTKVGLLGRWWRKRWPHAIIEPKYLTSWRRALLEGLVRESDHCRDPDEHPPG